MKLNLLYFGILRERLGRASEQREFPGELTVQQLLQELGRTDNLLALGAGSIRVAVHREYVDSAHVLADGDEVALIPPVAGGSGAVDRDAGLCRMTKEAIDLDAIVSAVRDPAAGAITTFLGTTRATNRGRAVLRLEYEAYDDMAVSEFRKIAAEAARRWELVRVSIVHRVGVVPLGEASVAIAVSAPHRRESIEACHYCIDALKLVAPIWKKEFFEGGEVWIGSLADCDHGDHQEGSEGHAGSGHAHDGPAHSHDNAGHAHGPGRPRG